MFGFKITYNKPDGYSLYNGNITQTQWKTSNDNILRRYDYEYDALNRLKESRFYKNNVAEQYHEGGIVYDKNGNIQNLKRWGLKNDATTLGLIDDLSYNYKVYSNQLLKVTDNSLEPSGFTDADNSRGDNDYGYDASGNMKKDLNKGIGLTLGEEITYNHLNLPVKIIKDDNNYLEFTYDATGTKLQKKEFNQGNETITQYLHGFVYLNNQLEYFAHPEGYVDKDFSYIYQYKDHLGNVRLSYKKNGSSLQILEEDNYYPFGLKHKGYNATTFSSSLGQKIKYQGQERQEELGINWDSFKYRNYDYAIGRFMSVDPLAEGYVYNSPYAFAENKIISNFELEGLEAKLAIYGEGGTGTSYTASDKATFRGRANSMKSEGYTTAKASNGQQLLSALRTATAQEGSIERAIIHGHAGFNGFFLNNDEGFYKSSTIGNGSNKASLSDLVAAMNDGSIKFDKNAVAIFGGCNTCNQGTYNPFSEAFTEDTGVTSIGATGYLSGEVVNGKETGRLQTSGTFIKTEKVFDVNVLNPISGQTMSTMTFPNKNDAKAFTMKNKFIQTAIQSRLQQTDLGNTIDPKKL